MKRMIGIYLLLKSMAGRKFSWFDIHLAELVVKTYEALRIYGAWNYEAPTWLRMIANMRMETELPEAWTDFRLSLTESIRDRFTFKRG